MPIRQKKPIKINGPVITAQGYNITNYLNNHINDYADEKEAAALLCYLFDVIDKKYFATHPSC